MVSQLVLIDLVTIPENNYEDIDYVLIPEGLVKTRVEKLAHDIFKDYCGPRETPIKFFVIMNGAFQFYSDLLFNLKKMAQYKTEKLYFETEFIKIKGYVNTESKLGEISDSCISESMVKDQDILIIEDIYDSGTLMSRVLSHINKFDPKSVETAVLMHKENPANLKFDYVAKYVGFTCPANKFIIGYGMDYNEHFRELSHVCVITNEGIEKYKIES